MLVTCLRSCTGSSESKNIVAARKIRSEHSDVIFIATDQHLKKLQKENKGVPILYSTVYYRKFATMMYVCVWPAVMRWVWVTSGGSRICVIVTAVVRFSYHTPLCLSSSAFRCFIWKSRSANSAVLDLLLAGNSRPSSKVQTLNLL